MSIQEIKSEIETLPVDERKRLAAFLVSLRHKEIEDYQIRMTRKIDDDEPKSWVTLEELDLANSHSPTGSMMRTAM